MQFARSLRGSAWRLLVPCLVSLFTLVFTWAGCGGSKAASSGFGGNDSSSTGVLTTTHTSTSSGGGGGQCGPGAQLCDGVCTVVNLDPMNCGKCGNACPMTQVCSNGMCAIECSGGTTQCGHACVNTVNDPANCGGCGK